MKTAAELKDAITNSVWELMKRTECVDLENWEIRLLGSEVDYFSEATPGGHVIFDGDAIVVQFEGADVHEVWQVEDVRRWVDNVVDCVTLTELQKRTLTLADCVVFEDVEAVAENTAWFDMGEEECHVQLIGLLQKGIELLDWTLDSAVLNCARLDAIARYDCAGVSAVFFDSQEGGPLPREDSDMFSIRVEGLDLCGLKYGTKYNTDGALILDRIASALGLPVSEHREYQDGWYEDEWMLEDIEK